MTIATLYNAPKTPQDWLLFSFANADLHKQIVTAIAAQRNILIPTYLLDPIPSTDIPDWSRRHQDVHNYQNAILGIAGSDLTDVDFKDPKQLEDWVWLHVNEMRQAAQMLGVD